MIHPSLARWSFAGTLLVLAGCRPSRPLVTDPDQASGLTAFLAAADSVCSGRLTCDSLLLDRTVRRIEHFLPSTEDSRHPAFLFPTEQALNPQPPWPTQIVDLGSDVRPIPGCVTVWVFQVSDPPPDLSARTYTVAFLWGTSSEIAVVHLAHDGARWVVRDIGFLVT